MFGKLANLKCRAGAE